MLLKPEIIFKNDSFIVMDKPAGLLSVRARGSLSGQKTAADWAREFSKEAFIVHRLDMETSGLIIFARTEAAQRELSGLFEKKSVEKKYRALVWGRVAENKGFIDRRIREFSSGRCAVDFDGKDSLTEYRVSERFKEAALLEVLPRTGRRHQIRVHLYSIGHPIVGDPLYGNIASNKKYPCLMLRAFSLNFEFGGEKFHFKAPADRCFDSVLSLFR